METRWFSPVVIVMMLAASCDGDRGRVSHLLELAHFYAEQGLWAGLEDAATSLVDDLLEEIPPARSLSRQATRKAVLDLLIHGIDQVEWITDSRIVALTARTGNLSHPEDTHLRDHASVYCELDSGATAVVEGQRMLPDTKGSDYRVTVAGTLGYADLLQTDNRLIVTTPEAADVPVDELPGPVSLVEDWLRGGDLVPQAASLRANRLALLATRSAAQAERIML